MESLGKNRLIHRKITSMPLALLLGAGGITALPPTALAAAPSNGTVSSTRSFPATTTTRRDLLSESVSTDVQSPYGQQPYMGQQPADTGSFGWAVLGFFFPIVGLILFLVWKSEKPVSAKQAGMGALASVISTVVLWILLIVFAVIVGSAVTY